MIREKRRKMEHDKYLKTFQLVQIGDDEILFKIRDGVKTIRRDIVDPQFAKNVTSVILPESLKEIYGGFMRFGITSITIPDNTQVILDHSFMNCAKLKRVYIPDTCSFGTWSFGWCPIEEMIVKVISKSSRKFLGSIYVEKIKDRIQRRFPKVKIILNDEKVKLEGYLYCALLFFMLREEMDETSLFESVYSYLY
jgi:hypothetical protein